MDTKEELSETKRKENDDPLSASSPFGLSFSLCSFFLFFFMRPRITKRRLFRPFASPSVGSPCYLFFSLRKTLYLLFVYFFFVYVFFFSLFLLHNLVDASFAVLHPSGTSIIIVIPRATGLENQSMSGVTMATTGKIIRKENTLTG